MRRDSTSMMTPDSKVDWFMRRKDDIQGGWHELFSRMEVRRFLSFQPGPLTSGRGLRISIDCEACTRRLGSNLGRPLMVLLSLRRSVKFMTSWSVPVEVSRYDWLRVCKHGLIIVPFKPRTTGYVGKAENSGSKQRVERMA